MIEASPVAVSVLVGLLGGGILVLLIEMTDPVEARRRAVSWDLAGAVLIVAMHISATRAVLSKTSLIERYGLIPIAVGLAFAFGVALLTNDGVPWVINLLAQDPAILVGVAGALWFGTMGWTPLGIGIEVLGMTLGIGQVMAVLVLIVALLDLRGVIEVDVEDGSISD